MIMDLTKTECTSRFDKNGTKHPAPLKDQFLTMAVKAVLDQGVSWPRRSISALALMMQSILMPQYQDQQLTNAIIHQT